MRGVTVLAFLLALVVATMAAAATAPDADRDGIADGVDNCPAIWNTDQADSDGNGIGDLCEESWPARDDDRDGVSNGADNCPLEPNADQSPLACAMRAITVPESPSNPVFPHATYSGASITLKGIARYGGNQYMWDFGDGTMPQPWTAISNPHNLGVGHVYTGSIGQNFIATLSVRSSAAPEVVSSASYRVQIMAASNLADPSHLDVRVRMAIDEAMWFLHQSQIRITFADGPPGYRQPYGYWPEAPFGHAGFTTCAAVDLFALHGSRPDANYGSDPYVEDVRRGLTYLLASAKVGAIFSQPAGNPDGNGNGVGVYLGNYRDDIETTGLCAKAFADTRAANRQALSGPAGVYGRLYKDIVQDTVDWFAFGQNDTTPARGSWGYAPNQQLGETRLNVFPILALIAAEERIGAVVPAFVRAETSFYFNYARHTALDNFNGGWGFIDSAINVDYNIGMGVTGVGLLAFNFRGVTASSAEAKAALGFMYRHWQDTGATTSCWDAHLGSTYAMFPVAMALKTMSPPPADVTEYNYYTGQQTTNRFDWYAGLATHLVTRQSATGQWNDTTGCGYLAGGVVTALDAIILMKEDVVPKPQAALCNCDFTWDKDSDVTFDGSCSDANNAARRLVKFEWDFHYDGTTFRPSTAGDGLAVLGTIVVKVGGFPAYGTYPVALRVTDDTPAEAGGAQTSVASCSITIKPGPHCPHVDAGGPYFAAPYGSIQLAASKTADVDGDAVTFEWDLDNDGMFDDAVGETVSATFSNAGTFVIAVRATDHPPTGVEPCSRVAYSTVKIGGPDVSLLTPGRPAATAMSANAVLVLWEPVPEAEQYELWRSQEGRSYAPLWKTSGTSFVDSSRPGLTSLYEVRTISSGGPSALSLPDAATTIVFSDRDLVGRPVRALHIEELRQAVDAMRLAARLSPGPYTNKISPSTMIRAVDLEELRTILEKTRDRLALPFMRYEETITPGVTSIKAAHFLELRAGTQ